MYARDSRYRFQDEVTRVDATGRELVVTSLRRRPTRPATVQHLLEEGERLDHLGQRYYRRPHRWWEICDANPGELSPLRLVGRDPLRTARLTLALPPPPTPSPQWHTVLAELRAQPGVTDVSLTDVELPVPGGAGVLAPAVLITAGFNQISVSANTLAGIVAAHGLTPMVSVDAGAAGTTIAVPPPSGRP